ETVLAEPSELGLGAALDAFFSSWSELASNPGSTTVRSVLRQRASELAGRFQTLAGNLDSIRQETETRLQLAVEEVTSMASNVADLNQQIVSIEADGTTAGDLRDARARLLDRMSELVPIQVSHRDNGSVGVTVAGVSIVDGANSSTVKVVVSGGVTGLGIEGRTGLFQDTGGSTGALIDLINTDLPTARQRLDDLAEALVTEVNTLHAGGTTPDGSTGVNFFDASATAASTIALSTEVRADVDAIAAGTADASGGYRAGANDVAEPVAALRDTVVASVGDTISESFRGLVSDIGEAVRSSTDAAEAHGVLAEQARLRRESLGGVSVDEELVRMIQFQTGYQAAARVVTAADEMLQSLLAI
ncbi:MAG: flagellar hook-associated protein FlgK, partial [Gemmatimonadota bacterium]